MENVATTHCFALFARFLHFHENNDLKVPERSKNGPKKVPILSQRPKFCLCSDFLRQVPNPKSYIVASGNITASFRKDGLKEWGVLLVVCPPSSSGCRQHRPSTLSWRVLQGIDHNNQVIETNTRCYCKTSLHRVHSHGRIVFACNFRHNFTDMSCIN